MTYALERPRPRRRQPNPPHWSHPILPKTEERRLLALAKTGDREARDQLILGNQQLVVRIARRYAHGFLDLDDLVSAGNRGLIHAIETFDPRRAGALSTHAAQWIRAKIVGELEAASYTVRTPRWILTVASKYRKTCKRLSDSRGRAPTFDATCDAIGLPKGERACLSFALATLRENAQVRPEDIATEDERLDEVEAKARDLETLGRMLAQLDPEARDLIADRWGLGGRKPMTLGQAGKARNRSAERIRQREVAAMQRLRQLAEGEQLCASA